MAVQLVSTSSLVDVSALTDLVRGELRDGNTASATAALREAYAAVAADADGERRRATSARLARLRAQVVADSGAHGHAAQMLLSAARTARDVSQDGIADLEFAATAAVWQLEAADLLDQSGDRLAARSCRTASRMALARYASVGSEVAAAVLAPVVLAA